MNLIYFPIVVSFFAIAYIFFLNFQIKKLSFDKNKTIQLIFDVQEGSVSYLKNQYKTIALIAVVLFLGLLVFSGLKISIGFLAGVVLSAISNILGIIVLAQVNTKIAETAKKGFFSIFGLTLKTGLIIGLSVVSFGLLAVSGYYFFAGVEGLIGLILGISLISVFSMALGGVYKKSLDLGVFLLKKNEKITPKNDSKNLISSSSLASEIIENSGMTGEILQTYVFSLSVSMILADLLFPTSLQFTLLPLIISSISILTFVVGSFFVKISRFEDLAKPNKNNLKKVVYKGIAIIAALSAISFYPVFLRLMQDQIVSSANLYFSCLIGLAIILALFFIVEHNAYKKEKQAKLSVKSLEIEHEISTIKSLENRIKSILFPVLIILLGMFFSFQVSSIYGITISVVSMISVSGIFVTFYSIGAISKNALEIAKFSETTEQSQKNINVLELVFKNTTKPVFINYAVISTSLSLIVLFFLFAEKVLIGELSNFILSNPIIIIGILIGGVIPYLLFAYSVKAIRRTSDKFKKELLIQIKNSSQEDFSEIRKCIKVGVKSVFQEMRVPLLTSALFPIIAGVFLGVEALGGILVGLVVVGTFIIILSALSDDKNSIFYKESLGLLISPIIKTISIVALLMVSFLI